VDLDLVSDFSNESTLTASVSENNQRDKKLEKLRIKSGVTLNNYLMKWIVIMIYMQISWVWSIAGVILPATPLMKLLLGAWILLPQFKGEFFLYNLLLD
jgi:hypothetical protein